MGSCHVGKYPWEVAAWENTFFKVPNIVKKPRFKTQKYLFIHK